MTMDGSKPVAEFPSEVSMKRFKVLWRIFLISNFAFCAYVLAHPPIREKGKKKKDTSTPAARTAPPQEEEEPIIDHLISKPVIAREPIPEHEQRDLFEWMLREKRLIKPKNREEKKRIDEEKAVLKEFIRSKSVRRF